MFDWFMTRLPVFLMAALVLSAVGGVVAFTSKVSDQTALAATVERYAGVVNTAVGSLAGGQQWTYHLRESEPPPHLPDEAGGDPLDVIFTFKQVILEADGAVATFPLFGHADPGYPERSGSRLHLHFWDPAYLPAGSGGLDVVRGNDLDAPELHVDFDRALSVETRNMEDGIADVFVYQRR